MENQKLENLLNLALSVPESEREKSLNLNEGYNQTNRTWELIIKYHGDLSRLSGSAIIIEDLIAGYAIVTIPENLIKPFSELDEVEYIEKPKRLYFNQVTIAEVKRQSCILPVTQRPPNLTGTGTIVTVIDSGIDYDNQAFRNQDGTTRILRLWDQSLQPDMEKDWLAPKGFQSGVEFTRDMINEAISSEDAEYILPTQDITGHGTAVAAIAAGLTYNEDNTSSIYEGIAPGADIVVVKLGNPQPDSFPRTTELMRALTYAVRVALEYNRPTAINISFGNTYGNHSGDSLLERFIDNISEIGKNCIIIGSGNEGASLGHTRNQFLQPGFVEFSVGNFESSLNVQIWMQYEDEFQIVISSPNGSEAVIESTRALAGEGTEGGLERRTLEGTELLIYVGEPLPYAVSQEIYIDMIPTEQYIQEGIWRIRFIPLQVVNGYVNMYLPSDVTRNENTFFLLPSPEMTLTIPSTSSKAITVGAYNSRLQAYADFSGRGYSYENVFEQRLYSQLDSLNSKPDIVAPGVEIESVAVGGGRIYVTGTSFATPIVAGSVALMLEWGIVKGNDPYLYGAKVKAYLRKGARPLPGFTNYPNAQVGWGVLCLNDSFPFA